MLAKRTMRVMGTLLVGILGFAVLGMSMGSGCSPEMDAWLRQAITDPMGLGVAQQAPCAYDDEDCWAEFFGDDWEDWDDEYGQWDDGGDGGDDGDGGGDEGDGDGDGGEGDGDGDPGEGGDEGGDADDGDEGDGGEGGEE